MARLTSVRTILSTLVLSIAITACGVSPSHRLLSSLTTTPVLSPDVPDASVTPPGWTPVAVGPIQISVPDSWYIQDPGYTCGGDQQGFVFVDQEPFISPNISPCHYPVDVAFIEAVPSTPPATARTGVRNQISVSTWSTPAASADPTTRYEQALDIRIGAWGPQAAQVLETITYSPSAFVISSPKASTPAGWKTVTFAGVDISVPPSWAVQQTSYVNACGPGGVGAEIVELDTMQSNSSISCPGGSGFPPGGVNGLLVEYGPLSAGQVPSTAVCQNRAGLQVCYDPPPPPGPNSRVVLGNLQVQAAEPGHPKPIQIDIGLTATGATAAAIFNSIHRHG